MASISRTGRWPVMSRSTLAFVSVLLAVASSGHPPIASVGSPQHPAFDDPVNAASMRRTRICQSPSKPTRGRPTNRSGFYPAARATTYS